MSGTGRFDLSLKIECGLFAINVDDFHIVFPFLMISRVPSETNLSVGRLLDFYLKQW